MSADGVVAVVLDPAFGERLREVAAQYHVWTVPSPDNRRVVEEIWQERKGLPEGPTVTIWTVAPSATEEGWLGILEDIETHHGEWSQDPPVNVLEVLGATPNDEIRRALLEYGYRMIAEREGGFTARRG
jgi:hypothetical protein